MKSEEGYAITEEALGRKNYFMLCPIKPTNVLHTKKKNIVVFEFKITYGINMHVTH